MPGYLFIFFKFFAFILLNTVSLIFPRRKNLWVFGSGFGSFEGNSKYLFLWVNQYHREIEAIWISKDESTALKLRALGYVAYRRWSISGIFYALSASKFIYSSYPSDINGYLFAGAMRVNLWHGVGIKKIEYGTQPPSGFLAKLHWHLKRLRMPSTYVKPHLLLSTSSTMTEHFATSFRIPHTRIIEASYPRNIGNEDPNIAKASKEYDDDIDLTEIQYNRVIVYAPSWSNYGSNLTFIRSHDDVSRLENTLTAINAVLFIKPHPNELFRDNVYTERLRRWPSKCDIYRFLRKIDVLITDYSSIYYDYLASGGLNSICYLPTDKVRDDVELALPQQCNLPEVRAMNIDELCIHLESIFSGKIASVNDVHTVRDRFFSFPTRKMNYIYQAILN